MILVDKLPSAPGRALQNASAPALAQALDARLAGLFTLEERIRAITAAIAGRIAFSTSLGIEDQAVTNAIAETHSGIDIFMLDTGRHFPQTYDTLLETEARYGIKIRVMFPDAKDVGNLVASDGIYGFRNSVDSRKLCCDIRKVRPLSQALSGATAWITGLRREQSQGRAHVPFAVYDGAQNLIKLNPIADWTLADLEGYVALNKIPLNLLHAHGFPSIGCQPCTRAIKPGEDIRAGRWWWENEIGTECGLHAANDAEASKLAARSAVHKG